MTTAGEDVFNISTAATVVMIIPGFETGSDSLGFNEQMGCFSKNYEEIANITSDISIDANVVVVGGVTTITEAAAIIAADESVTGSDGFYCAI